MNHHPLGPLQKPLPFNPLAQPSPGRIAVARSLARSFKSTDPDLFVRRLIFLEQICQDQTDRGVHCCLHWAEHEPGTLCQTHVIHFRALLANASKRSAAEIYGIMLHVRRTLYGDVLFAPGIGSAPPPQRKTP